jgi:hypothetical protein
MAFNFPANPSSGDTYTSNNILFRYDGTRWAVETAVSDVIQFVRTGTLAQRPTVTQPTLYYNTDLEGLELYYPEIDTWEVVSTFAKQVDPTQETGQIAYTSPGTYSWVCPANVYQVHALCIGGGGSGRNNNSFAGGGGGGGLAWLNNIPVTPGQSYTVQVGGNTFGTDGGDSFFISTSTVAGFGGKFTNSSSGGAGGTFFTTIGPGGGGNGGLGGTCTSNNVPGGGGGAGGYSGNGGAGGNSVANGFSGSGGAAGGGGGSNSNASSAFSGGAGGGVGIFGQGTSGAGGARDGTTGRGIRGGGGSGGVGGSVAVDGGAYGGGGGGTWAGTITPFGAPGAVRLIWGPNRAFPSTNTGDL